MSCNQDGTIVAMATPPGRSAIALVRVSGPQARKLVSQRLQRQRGWPRRQAFLARFLDRKDQPLDRVLITFFPGPASYTGEDLVEISCHGSPVLVGEMVESLLQSGARLAEPGEFTMRAFLNGKMDLAQAEAVRDLVESQTVFQAKVAAQQLEGSLSRRLQPVREQIVTTLCHMETALEFVEDEVNPEDRSRLAETIEDADLKLRELEESFQFGRLVQEGMRVLITGRPNAGKSSVFNTLIMNDRAIVTEIPGTTRDALTETIDLAGIPVRLADTAGIREASDLVERLGVEKSLEYLRESDAVLFVIDQSIPFDQEDFYIWEMVREHPCVLVVNKEDLPSRVAIPNEVEKGCLETVQVSALRHTHFQELKAALLRVSTQGQQLGSEGVMVTNIRHKQCLESARHHLRVGLEAYQSGMSEEFPLHDFRKALEALGQITGETTTEDILEQIFSTFCIGK
ncbi:MAG: tRNA uridine-5-carboxymethylaminomethyl(34) synthesis GTPase MnmE [Acidobacteria bacterium]|nr:tRNA uridine-5-carboxymethylaminomethyl(34) synthesis GTPase MnmE [Acidobacteriota bacterium]